jgi:hypothetical protein
MAIFKDEDDAIKFAIRKLHFECLMREVNSNTDMDNLVKAWKANGGDSVYASLADSTEGQKVTKARRQALGLP